MEGQVFCRMWQILWRARLELAVLNISHFYRFTAADHHRLIDEILLRLGG